MKIMFAWRFAKNLYTKFNENRAYISFSDAW
jgi:hypothetical protein